MSICAWCDTPRPDRDFRRCPDCLWHYCTRCLDDAGRCEECHDQAKREEPEPDYDAARKRCEAMWREAYRLYRGY